jgi:L-threonylcarbamoyladenylate synthase
MTEILSASAAASIEAALAALRRGELIGVPTETVYGLATLPTAKCVARLVAVKRRSGDKGIQLLVDSVAQARRLAELTPAAERLARAFWPGPLTLVLPTLAGSRLPALINAGRKTVGVRLPDHPVPRRLAREVGPLAASSANISGQPDATTAEQAAAVGAQVSLVLDDGPVRGGLPSTVVDCSPAADPVRLLRIGALSEADIRAALHE